MPRLIPAAGWVDKIHMRRPLRGVWCFSAFDKGTETNTGWSASFSPSHARQGSPHCQGCRS